MDHLPLMAPATQMKREQKLNELLTPEQKMAVNLEAASFGSANDCAFAYDLLRHYKLRGEWTPSQRNEVRKLLRKAA